MNLAVIGATGLVGEEILKVLQEKKIKINELTLVASNKSIGKDVFFAVDAAASELYKNGKYELLGINKTFDTQEMIEYWSTLSKNFPILSIEDPLEENDFDGFAKLTSKE